MSYQINTSLDINDWSVEYRRDSRCRVQNFLERTAAAEMVRDITNNPHFRQAHIFGEQYREISKEEFSLLSVEQQQQLIRDVYAKAARGVGFWYGRSGLSKQASAPLDSLFAWLNSDLLLDTVRAITGIASLTATSGQITCFAPGDFLTRHRDDVTSEGRRVAFVLNLTEQWHPDWGGLLQFFHDNGDTRESWSPQFNSLCLFDVKHVHSVTTIAPFAPRVRIAISGWFHDREQA